MRLRHLTVTALTGALAVAGSSAPAFAAQPERVSVATTAHRGAMAYAPENTLAAFQLGIDQGATWIESDVQLTKDGETILMHDTTLARTTDVEQVFPDRAPWRVQDFTLAEIKQLDAGSWFGPEFAGEPVPTLAEMVSQVRSSRAGIIMELKSPELYPGVEQKVIDVFASFPGYMKSALASERLSVQSFNWDSMKTYAQLAPETPVGLLGAPAVADLPAYAEWAEQINPSAGQATAAYIDQVHANDMEVNVWTVNDVPTMTRLLDWGVDGIITNTPDVLEALLHERSKH
ncbi:glycerophosphodiester phosphodiesterase family protein [Microbacterium sp.]|uniref:glycerophosphodiester phosphodiesterase n=1 Tax=Microbacterium sp. TaxID=51671 RepID=UPI0028122D82|nr:glycerophosphodiester phosphodiesterase family protein [Microbacterium sp.]